MIQHRDCGQNEITGHNNPTALAEENRKGNLLLFVISRRLSCSQIKSLLFAKMALNRSTGKTKKSLQLIEASANASTWLMVKERKGRRAFNTRSSPTSAEKVQLPSECTIL